MRKLISSAAAAFCMVLSSPVSASGFCQGSINNVLVRDDGNVLVEASWRMDWTGICNLNEPRLGISTGTCWAWFAELNEAITFSKPVILLYHQLNSDAECATLPTYGSSPAPGYVMLRKQ